MANEFKPTLSGGFPRDRTTNRSRYVNMGGFEITRATSVSLIELIRNRMASGRLTNLFFANSNFVVRCQGLRQQIDGSHHCLIVNDGIGVDIGAMLLGHPRFKENLNGTDFVPALLASTAGLRIFLYGGRSASVQGAREYLEHRGHQVVGVFDGYDSKSEDVREALRAATPDLVLVALGNPRQEAWILENSPELTPSTYIGVGALFDFMSGAMPRAPQWMRSVRMEWLFRLYKEPRRLVRRYTIDFLKFLYLCLSLKS